jgi:hypothetical protein
MNPEILEALSTATTPEEIHRCLTVLPEEKNK